MIEPLRVAFGAYSARLHPRALRVRSTISSSPGTATVLFPGTAVDVPAYTVKVHAKFPAEQPAIRGVLCLHDGDTGELLAVMDSTHLTGVRTGLVGAMAANTLARPDADTVAVIGAGAQGRHQLRALKHLRLLRYVYAYDVVPERAATFAEEMAGELDLPVQVSATAAAAMDGAAIVLVATWSRKPFIVFDMLASGAHVNTLGADEPGKAEVDGDTIRKALFVCDDRELAVELGAVGAVGLGRDVIDAELGEVFGGSHPGRTSREQRTIYGGVGLAFQDTIAAWQVYSAAKETGVGTEIDFLG